jgi:hypothetical protein
MELWQMDVMGGVHLADGGEVKVVTGIDDHSRFDSLADERGEFIWSGRRFRTTPADLDRLWGVDRARAQGLLDAPTAQHPRPPHLG